LGRIHHLCDDSRAKTEYLEDSEGQGADMSSSVTQEGISREKAHGFGLWLSKWLVLIYRFHLGWLLGHRFALITQPVCRSGMLWQTGVLISHYDRHSRRVHIIASRDADWYHSLRASPAVEIAIARERYRAEHRRLGPIEIAVLLRWSSRHRPIALRIQSTFSGWPYRASDQELWHLAQSLGGAAFRPASIDD